ncbi:MAG: hemolysin III family protein [Pirellulales bacterium]
MENDVMEMSNYTATTWTSAQSVNGIEDQESYTALHYDFHQPLHHHEELANAVTHGAAAIAMLIGTIALCSSMAGKTWITIAFCVLFSLSCCAVFTASALSHCLLSDQRLLKKLRSWDQGLIYVMIAGTYTPLVWTYAESHARIPLLIGMWIAAIGGFLSKVVVKHRVNSMGLTTYLILGWAPAFWLFMQVPKGLLFWMLAGCVCYIVGVLFLMNDRRKKYFHVMWHLCVIAGATMHYMGVYNFVALVQ